MTSSIEVKIVLLYLLHTSCSVASNYQVTYHCSLAYHAVVVKGRGWWEETIIKVRQVTVAIP